MTQSVNVTLSNSQLDILKSATKNETRELIKFFKISLVMKRLK